MAASFRIEPVAIYQVAVRIEVSEECVGDDGFPCIVLDFAPTLDDFGALDYDVLAGCSGDAFTDGIVPDSSGDRSRCGIAGTE